MEYRAQQTIDTRWIQEMDRFLDPTILRMACKSLGHPIDWRSLVLTGFDHRDHRQGGQFGDRIEGYRCPKTLSGIRIKAKSVDVFGEEADGLRIALGDQIIDSMDRETA